MVESFTLYFDGSCWPNPGGEAAYGYVLYRGAEKITSGHDSIGRSPEHSNNVAEFLGLAAGFKAFGDYRWGQNTTVILNVYGDSQLVINIMSKKWNPGAEKLYYPAYLKAFFEARGARWNGAKISYTWIPREQNTECDELSKLHLKEQTKEQRAADYAQQFGRKK